MNLQAKQIIRSGIIFFYLLLAISFHSYAQLNSGNLTQFTEKDGLPGVQVNSVLIDRHGYLWAGTINGLARYDGYEFKRFYYNPNDTASIHGLVVFALFEDHHGKIWIGTNTSFLNLYDPVFKTFKQYGFKHLINCTSNIEPIISAICEDNNGRIYFGVTTYYGESISTGLVYKDEKDQELKRFKTPDSLAIANVISLTKDKAGNIWCMSFSGLFKIDSRGKLTKIHITALGNEFNLSNEIPTDLKFDNDGHAWMITTHDRLIGVNIETGDYKVWLPNINPTSINNFTRKVMAMDKEDNIWLATDDGIWFFNRKTSQFSSFNNGVKKELEHVPLIELKFDGFGTLWAGTNADGLIKYEERPQLKSYVFNKADKNSITPGWANYFYEASDGKIWIVTSGAASGSGINVLDVQTGKIQPIPFSTLSTKSSDGYCIWENSPGELYLSVFRGIYAVSSKTRKAKQIALRGVPDSVTVISHFKDSRENEWLCAQDGLYKKDNGSEQFRKYDLSKVSGGDAASNWVTRVYESKKHGLWLLTNNGLFLYNYNTDKIERHGYDKHNGDIFVTQDINSFYEDPNGIAWVGTWQGGLSRYIVETKRIKTYTRDDGLPSMSIQSILADEKNNSLWLATFDGLSRFNLATQQFSNFSIADGIQGQLFADGSFLKTSNGLFVFGGSNGITIFNPDEVNKNSIPPKVFLTGLKLFDKSIVPGENSILKKPIDETGEITLRHNQNNLSIEFIAIHYSNPSKNRHSYKLENYDNQWRDVGNQHTAFYPNLPPGQYTFRVKAANDKGVWNEQGATLKIIVNPPWWKTTWAYIMYAVLITLLGFATDRYLRKQLVRKERERSRTRELEQAKEIEKAYYKLEETHEALKATQSQLIQSEKMASLGELTAGIAHEIQNPLNFVNNFSEVNKELIAEMKNEIDAGNLKEAKTIARNIEDNEEKINHHGKRADAIVKGMLQHSRVSTGQKEPADINALADEYLRLAYHGMRAKDKNFNATLRTDFDSSIGKINIVPQDIGRVILNLINNAFYAVTEKRSLGIEGYEPIVTVTTKRKNDKIEIWVRDNGPGIPPKIMEKIFQPFFTTKPTGDGTGLGLSLSYDIVKAHGGEIKVETKEGEGAEFIIQLPSG